MAQVKYNYPIESLSGRVCKKEHDGTILRRKRYRDADGNIICEGVNESFRYHKPRDYKKNPPRGEEERNISVFRQAVQLAKVERSNPERLAYWSERWRNQLNQGEAGAPVDPATGQPHIYLQLHIFIQTVIQRELKAGTWQNPV